MDKKQLTKLITYFTLGDGGVYYSGKECRFVMNMLEKNSDYVEWVASVLQEVTGTSIRRVVDDREGRKPTLNVTTKTHPIFTTLRDRIYIDGYKGIDPHSLKLLDWESLAILYMCDGSLYVEKPNTKKGLVNNSYSVMLHMKRLSYGDQFLLKKALKEQLDLEWNIQRGGKYYFLRLRGKDIQKFMEGVSPYMKESFSYKLIRTIGPNMGDDIVCSTQECVEVGRNDQP
jgi:hypothetical protein